MASGKEPKAPQELVVPELLDADNIPIVLGSTQEYIGDYKGFALVKQYTGIPHDPVVLHCLIPDPTYKGRFYRNWIQFDYQGPATGEKIDALAVAKKYIDGYNIPESAPFPIIP